MEYEDMTPTWETAARIHLMCIENGDNENAKQGARDEIIRLARMIDAQKEDAENEEADDDNARWRADRRYQRAAERDELDLY
jgi:hypothetical protein